MREAGKGFKILVLAPEDLETLLRVRAQKEVGSAH